ncbi:hypothetical protein RFI_35207 [Reticulomyxa filosa]|uniref:Uncharacterized protein n=1 Tax=Reticulomyxa filosa TaxID=46433 RepID=X6LKS8_RETFI|nr:hypothetical protein RFI_35207 [Reticulomyxa filosa]|eukprot:ETO02229.1 hypothetical protein RFI_35207 [Reticulomyxa filosa]
MFNTNFTLTIFLEIIKKKAKLFCVQISKHVKNLINDVIEEKVQNIFIHSIKNSNLSQITYSVIQIIAYYLDYAYNNYSGRSIKLQLNNMMKLHLSNFQSLFRYPSMYHQSNQGINNRLIELFVYFHKNFKYLLYNVTNKFLEKTIEKLNERQLNNVLEFLMDGLDDKDALAKKNGIEFFEIFNECV